jgi:serine/threonine protein kinase
VMSSSPSSDAKPGEKLGRYTVVRRLASGGMAEVYLARHEGPKGFSKLVVIKRVLPGLEQSDKFTAMFLDEGRLAARLSHPSIAQTFELGEHEGNYHLVMEYVPGESLNRLVRRAGLDSKPVPAAAVLKIGIQVLEALDYAHELKGDRGESLRVVHRDVSPTNVIVTYHGGVKLLDFGIASATIQEHHTQIGTVKGKGGYMAPEQALAAPVDQRTDLYAVGSLLYLLLTGVGPFDDEEDVFAMMRAAIEGRFPKPSARNASIHPELEEIILKATARKPEDRFPSAGAMLAALEAHSAAQRVFPSTRELAAYMRVLFPERVELAHSFGLPLDEELVDKLAESFNDLGKGILSTPTKLARRPATKAEDVAAPPRSPAAPKAKKAVGDTEDRTGPGPLRPRPLADGLFQGPTTQVPQLRLEVGGAASEVPITGERATQQGPAQFVAEEADEKTIGVNFRRDLPPALSPPIPGKTMTGEHDLTGPSLAAVPDPGTSGTDAYLPLARTSSLNNMASVGDLVANNPWAFVVAGLAAVLLGVAVLWALGGD